MNIFISEIDWDRYFRFDKMWITTKHWKSLSAAAKTVLLVIACHCNKRGKAFPGEKTIARLSGRTKKTVRQGISDLKGFPGFDYTDYKTKRGKQSKIFHLQLPPEEEPGRSYHFHRAIMDCGAWSLLTPTAQALYPVMRYWARYIAAEDESLENLIDLREHYKNRKWEICTEKINQLANDADIDRHSVKEAINSLTENCLIDPYETKIGEKGWKVFFTPQIIRQANYQNQSYD